MKRFESTSITILVISMASLVGCVSTSKYKKLETNYNAMKVTNAGLLEDVDKLQKANGTLNQEKQDLQKAQENSRSQYEGLLGQLQQEVQEGQLAVTQYKDMLTVDVAEKIFFASGSAKLKKTGQAVLKKVGDALAKFPDKAILVVGHTDAVPLAKSYQNIFPTNWELSVSRATNVVRFLQDNSSIAPELLIAAGRSQYDPIAPNDTAAGRQKNRRIEISLIDKNLLSTVKATATATSPAPEATPAPQATPTPTPEPTPAVESAPDNSPAR